MVTTIPKHTHLAPAGGRHSIVTLFVALPMFNRQEDAAVLASARAESSAAAAALAATAARLSADLQAAVASSATPAQLREQVLQPCWYWYPLVG